MGVRMVIWRLRLGKFKIILVLFVLWCKTVLKRHYGTKTNRKSNS